MVRREAANHWMNTLMLCLTILALGGCSYLGSMSAAPSQSTVFSPPEGGIDSSLVAMKASPSIPESQDSDAMPVKKDDDKKHKKCRSVVVDEDGRPIKPEIDETGKKHWYCGQVPNGAGGYQCSALYLNRSGCENCSTCKCKNVGSGAGQYCDCQ